MDRNGNLQPVGIGGELCIGGDGVARGYLNNPELTNSRFPAVPPLFLRFSASQLLSFSLYRTGDLARWLPDGDLEFLGRIDHQVKIRGFRIELAEIEEQLLKHEDIKEAVVICKGEKGDDKYLCAYIVPMEAGGKSTVVQGLRKYLARALPHYMIPSYFIPLDNIPLTPNGKIDRKVLPEPAVSSGEEYAAPRSDTERQLAYIWAEVLNAGKIKEKVRASAIGINDNFFHLGGHSMTAVVMIARIHQKLHVKIPLKEVFKNPTVKGLAEGIKKLAKDTFVSIEPMEEKEYYPLSSAQKRLYTLYQLDEQSTAYNMSKFISLEGAVDRDRLENTYKKFIRRHEGFRTSFRMRGNEPVQRIHKEGEIECVLEYFDLTGSSPAGAPGERREGEIIKTFIRRFELSRPPLLRMGLIRAAEGKYILMVDMPHIISDGTSMELFQQEFRALYAGEELPGARLQYRDFSQWQNRLIESGAVRKQNEYWLNRFWGKIPVLDLPLDYPRPPGYKEKGNRISFAIDMETIAGIKQLVREAGTTVYMVFLAVYNILLAKYSGQEDIVVGTPIAGRRHPDLENIIGLFANMLPMRNRPGGGKTFLEFLADVKENALNAYENQDFQFESLVWDLKIKLAPSRNPLFDVVFILRNPIVSEIHINNREEVDRVKTSAYGVEVGKVHYDLLLQATELNGNIFMFLEYSTELFKAITAERMVKHYLEIFKQILEDRELKLRDIKISHDLMSAGSGIIREDESDFRF
jgi:acyl carrier protein